MGNVIEHYENYDEDIRLVKDKVHKIEYITTLNILKEYIKGEMNIIDVGAGTGRYSFYYAEGGNNVTAVDIVPKHINIMKEKLEQRRDLNISIKLGNATDLSEFADESFDIVLCFGPLYHIKDTQERDKCIKECLRVLKKEGILAVAYINKLFITTMLVKQSTEKNLKEELLSDIIDNGTVKDTSDSFLINSYFFLPGEIEDYMKSFNTVKLEHVAADGIGMFLGEMINRFSDEEYEEWMKYHLKTCREPSILGCSNHGLYVCRKK